MSQTREHELGQFIPLHYHHNMLNDTVRMRGFKAAIEHAVQPGMRVLELGGGTGVLSFFAAQKAQKVYCVERNPELVRSARANLARNVNGHRVDVIEADAFDYLPPEPVDVVICEMIHVAMLREQQIPVIESFKRRYLEKFGGPLPLFIPEALVQAVQPVQQSFEFEGYNVPTVLFQDPGVVQSRTRELAIPAVYQLLSYENDLPLICESSGTIPIEQSGTLNALRFITKNILAIVVDRQETIDWHSQYLIVPLAQPLNVAAGDSIFLRFAYEAGASFAALTRSLRISHFRAAVAAHADHYWNLPAQAKGATALAAHAS